MVIKYDKNQFGINLRRSINRKGYTFDEAAERMNMSTETLSKYFHGRKIPNLNDINAMGTALEVHPKELLIGVYE